MGRTRVRQMAGHSLVFDFGWLFNEASCIDNRLTYLTNEVIEYSMPSERFSILSKTSESSFRSFEYLGVLRNFRYCLGIQHGLYLSLITCTTLPKIVETSLFPNHLLQW